MVLVCAVPQSFDQYRLDGESPRFPLVNGIPGKIRSHQTPLY